MSEVERITVLHYTGYDDDGGGIVSVVRALADAGRCACVLGLNPGALQRRNPPLPVLELPRVAGEHVTLCNFWRARGVARVVADWLRSDPKRVFHGHTRTGLLVALWLLWMGERRLVVSVHCYGRRRWFYRWAARRLGSRLFWLSPEMRAYYGVTGDGWVQCIPGGVPFSRVQPTPGQPGRLRLGGIGAIEGLKNWAVVIEALAQLPPAEHSAVSFTHIGSGEPRLLAELKALATARGVAAQVAFRGPEPGPERLLAEIDALVVATRNEAFSMAMIEALAAGVPVLAADTGGACDVIREGVNGRLHRTGDPAALAAQLSEWLAQPPGFDAAAIRATAVPIKRVAAQWEQVYAQL